MVQLQLSEQTEKRLKQVMALHPDTDRFFNNIINSQIDELKLGMLNIEKDLKTFEVKYKMSSLHFHEKFLKGELGDDDDFMIWAGIYEMLLRDKIKLEQLQW